MPVNDAYRLSVLRHSVHAYGLLPRDSTLSRAVLVTQQVKEGAHAEAALKPCGEVVRMATMKMKNTTTRKMKMIWFMN